MIKAAWITLLILPFCFTCEAQSKTSDKLKPPIASLPQTGPARVDMSSDTIKTLVNLINTNPPNDFRGMVVIKDNKLVVEEYFNTYWRETIHDIRSAGKSITALLLGIAIDKGLVKSVEQSIYDLLPPAKFKAPTNDAHRDIRIKHLLTMSCGLNADDDDSNSPGATANWLTKDDWVNYAISLPMSFTPGKKFVYNDVCPMLIGAVIEEAAGMKLSDFARINLFEPLGIREVYWYTAANGRTGPMGNLYLSTLDFARIGLLVLNKGRWQGKQLISEAFINDMTTKRFDISKTNPFTSGYGYLWYTGSKVADGKAYEYIAASGNGGNVLFIVPSENMVVSLTSSAYGQGYGHQRSHNIFAYILKSL